MHVYCRTTVTVIIIWVNVSFSYTLFNGFLPVFIQIQGGPSLSENDVYRNYFIQTACGLPGTLLAYYTVDMKTIGRRGALTVGSLGMGISLLLFITSVDPAWQLVFNCVTNFFGNIV